MLGTPFKTFNQVDGAGSFSFKRPKLLSHQFNLQRQQLLLLNIKSNSSVSILYEQDRKLEQLDDFIYKLSESVENYFNHHDSQFKNEEEKEIWCIVVLEGLEMFLRALKSILSNHSHKLGLRILKLKLKLLTFSPSQSLSYEKELKIEECFGECLKINGNTQEIEIFEEYFGINSVLDTLIGTKITEFMLKKNLKEKIKICLDFQKKLNSRSDGGQENIQRELIKNVFEDVKNNNSDARHNLHWEVMLNLLEILMNSSFSLDINQLIDNCLIVFQGNRFEFLNNANVFDKFLRFLNTPRIRNSPSFGSVVVTSFNSRIRSFLGKIEAKNENVVVSCTKFVLEFFTIEIGCIEQFAEFLLKCQLISINSIKNSQNRFLIYKLFKLFMLKTKRSLIDEAGNLFYENLNNELKMEFATNLVNNASTRNPKIRGDYILLNCSTEYFNESYMKIVDKIISRHIKEKEDLHDDEMSCCDEDEELFEGCFDNESGELELDYKLFLKLLSKISGLLLDKVKISWTDLTGVLGPSVGSSNSLKSEGRASFCFVYSQWLKLELNNFQVKTLLKNVLNPSNSAELWARSLFDFDDYGQVEFINLYYNYSSTTNYLNSRIDCFKKLELPAKFMLEMMMKSIDFRSCHSTINLSFWNYLIEFGDFLIKSKPTLNLKGIFSAVLTKYLPTSDLQLILKFYEMYWQDVNEFNFEVELKVPCRDLIIGFIRKDPCVKKSHELINSLLSGDGWKTRAVFLDIFNEFMKVVIDIEITGTNVEVVKEVFLVQLALASAVPFIFTDQMDRNLLSDSLLNSLTTKATTTTTTTTTSSSTSSSSSSSFSNIKNLKLVYIKLFLLCELKVSFDYSYCKVSELLIELLNLCGKDFEGYEEFLYCDSVGVNKKIKNINQTKIIYELQREISIERIHFKNSNPIFLNFNNDENISPVDCLILLLKLLEADQTDRLYNLKMFIKKRIMCKDINIDMHCKSESNLLFDLYFNI